jgi:hypothetical protein
MSRLEPAQLTHQCVTVNPPHDALHCRIRMLLMASRKGISNLQARTHKKSVVELLKGGSTRVEEACLGRTQIRRQIHRSMPSSHAGRAVPGAPATGGLLPLPAAADEVLALRAHESVLGYASQELRRRGLMKLLQHALRTTGAGRCGRSRFAALWRAWGGSWSSHRMSWSNLDLAGRRERDWGTGEEPFDGAVRDLGECVRRREGPPWLPLGRVKR